MSRTVTYVKALVGGAVLCIGGPALVMYVSPSEEEIFKKYNPDLQKRSLAEREQKQKDFDEFVTNLKQASKSDKPIWAELKAMERRRADSATQQLRNEQAALAADAEKRRAEIRSSAK
ncbi:CBP4-domain-containing protein [Melanomma pulvis-pyrius CBS 109.77]|uniref:Cytochrome b mRNA-processing protein 4 n=1 Tax=Melanomma pulvis-pyrius CBS 109.77 TaxID=1314802 RepID=A0A6A6XS91_9PLEO|nr:CBP4-domain-containing protein [Melanomma pulvis-pyrius CBS 109.77]